MTLAHLCEIDFYIDGELEPEDACAVEACIETDTRARRLFDAVWRQKETLARALEAAAGSPAANSHTARLLAELAQALSCGLASRNLHAGPTTLEPR